MIVIWLAVGLAAFTLGDELGYRLFRAARRRWRR